jgi:hypothetical protein
MSASGLLLFKSSFDVHIFTKAKWQSFLQLILRKKSLLVHMVGKNVEHVLQTGDKTQIIK